MSEQTKEVLLLAKQAFLAKPFASTITLLSYCVVVITSFSFITNTGYNENAKFLTDFAPKFALMWIYLALSMSIFQIFLTEDVFEKQKHINFTAFRDRVFEGVKYTEILKSLKPIFIQLVIMCIVFAVFERTMTPTGGTTEPTSVNNSSSNEIDFSFLVLSTLMFSITSSIFAALGHLNFYCIGIGSGCNGLPMGIVRKYTRQYALIIVFNAIPMIPLQLLDFTHVGAGVLMAASSLMSAAIIRHHRGDRAEEKQTELEKDLAYNF
ncbi:hypothetical protein [Vibrio sp. D431a]|uniref:hypothetical protein n=1 Tax=Vibrio sp. D431a TaxID=2837388 RepID=UPI0025542289|nr:hypothetical protein [Vibrio sp. D431a]MDK9789925.1 hypothetical protein [Vibrio sp. D431a]